jgi:hypothetical protein
VTREILRCASIDDILGPSESRFFSAGYKRIGHDVRDVWFGRRPEFGSTHAERAAGGARISATASLSYPGNWSIKSKKTQLRPHLSTIDALALAVQLAEASLVYRHRLTTEQRRRMWVRRVTMKAGTQPVEDLDALPIEAVALRTERTGHGAGAGAGEWCTAFSANIGSLKVDLEIEHEESFMEIRPAFSETLEGILGPSDERYYGARYKDADLVLSHLALSDLALDPSLGATYGDAPAGLTARTQVRNPADRHSAPHGTGAAYLPGLTVLDSVIALPQLAQVLMYGLDGMSRSASDTLWMRKVTVNAPRPLPLPDEPLTARVGFTRTGSVRLQGDTWRTAELSGQLHGMTATASLAHRLPAAIPRQNLIDVRQAQHSAAARQPILLEGTVR